MVVTISNTGLPAYSDSAGTAKECHCKRVSLYPMIFRIRTSFIGPKNCHCSSSLTLTGVTVSGEACITDEVERPVVVDVLVDLQDDADHVGVHRVQVQGQPRPVQVAPNSVHLH